LQLGLQGRGPLVGQGVQQAYFVRLSDVAMFHQDEEKARLRRERTKEAIALAMDSRWEEAVVANQSILEAVPGGGAHGC
jgi:hypothetical protein